MKTPVTITAIHIEVRKTSEHPMGIAMASVEIDGKWVGILYEHFNPDGCHLSHIIEGAGILRKAGERMTEWKFVTGEVKVDWDAKARELAAKMRVA